MTAHAARRRPGVVGSFTLLPFLSFLLAVPALPGCGPGSSETARRGTDSEEAGYPPPPPGTSGPSRVYHLSWTIRVDAVPKGARNATVWIAVPPDLDTQSVSDLAVDTAYPWDLVKDPDFGDPAVRVTVSDPPESLAVSLSARVERRSVIAPLPATLTETERRLYLREEGLVSLSPRIRALADSVDGGNRTRYDYVLKHMTYDKSAPGWGNGDSERACDVRKGNCTDFHSLFMSLSRAEGVPAVFVMGYPTVPEGETNRVGGYHCWAYFYDDSTRAWVPVDISEADLHPEKAEFFFGHLDPDRIAFSRGRNVRLPGMQGKPLNYFPAGAYVEVDGAPHDAVTRNLTYTVGGE